MEDEQLVLQPLYRSLSERVYLFKFGFIHLTETDLGVCLASFGLGYVFIGAIGLGQVNIYFNFLTLDPWFGVFMFATTVILISIINMKRPDANSTDYLRWLFTRRKIYSVNSKEGNPFWMSTFRPYLFNRKRRNSHMRLWWLQ